MSYKVKEIFYSLQGEGGNTGRPAIFLRFADCNLACPWCDTNFQEGTIFTSSDELAVKTVKTAPGVRFVVLTGGEPLLQVDTPLLCSLRKHGVHSIAVETNGTQPVPDGIDWVCVSPKSGHNSIIKWGQEIKIVYPQEGIDPQDFIGQNFGRFYLQPMAGPNYQENLQKTVAYCLEHPKWRLSLQTHKLLGIR